MPGPPGFSGPPGQPFLSRSDNEGPGPLTGSFVVDREVVAGSDDAFERPGQPIEITGTGLISAHVGSRTALRCTDLPFQQGAEIVVFTVSATADNTDKVDAEGTWYAHAIDDAPTFSAVEEQIMDLPLTTASVPWNDNDLGVAGDRLTSPNLAAVVQEIVNRPGWEPGNAIAVVYVHNSTVDVLSIAGFEHATHPPASFHGEYELVPQVSITLTGALDLTGSLEVEVVAGIDLDPDDATQAHTADNVTLTQVHNLAIDDATQAHTAANVTLTQAHVLAVDSATQGHTAAEPAFTQTHVLAVDAATQGHTADTPTFSTEIVLTIADATQAHTAGEVALTQVHQLAIDNAVHGHTAGEVTLSQVHILSIDAGAHAHEADLVALFVGEIFTPPERIESVGPELRTLVADREVRVLVMVPQTRVRVLA